MTSFMDGSIPHAAEKVNCHKMTQKIPRKSRKKCSFETLSLAMNAFVHNYCSYDLLQISFTLLLGTISSHFSFNYVQFQLLKTHKYVPNPIIFNEFLEKGV